MKLDKKQSFDQRRACVYANGGIDPHSGEEVQGTRNKMEQHQLGLDTAREDAKKLADLEDQVANFHVKQGDEQFQAMAAFANKSVSAEMINGVGFALASSCLLFGGGILGFFVLDSIETKRAAARAKRKT